MRRYRRHGEHQRRQSRDAAPGHPAPLSDLRQAGRNAASPELFGFAGHVCPVRPHHAHSILIAILEQDVVDVPAYLRHPYLKPVGQDGTESAMGPDTTCRLLRAGTVPRPDADTPRTPEAAKTRIGIHWPTG